MSMFLKSRKMYNGLLLVTALDGKNVEERSFLENIWLTRGIMVSGWTTTRMYAPNQELWEVALWNNFYYVVILQG